MDAPLQLPLNFEFGSWRRVKGPVVSRPGRSRWSWIVLGWRSVAVVRNRGTGDLRHVELRTGLGFQTHSDQILARLDLHRFELVVLVRRAGALSALAFAKSFEQLLFALADLSHLDQDRRLVFVNSIASHFSSTYTTTSLPPMADRTAATETSGPRRDNPLAT